MAGHASDSTLPPPPNPRMIGYADARANRRDPFFNVPAGGADICNIPVPVRHAPL